MSWLEYPQIPRCKANARSGICNQALNENGECPMSAYHVRDIELPPVDAAQVRMDQARDEAAERLLNAIFGVEGRYDSEQFDRQITDERELERWEGEGGFCGSC